MAQQPLYEELPDTLVAEPALEEPPLYDVLLLNDDYTTMEFVIDILIKIFCKSKQQAETLMYKVHEHGEAVCATYPREIAETKVEQVISHARENDYPLLCIMRLH